MTLCEPTGTLTPTTCCSDGGDSVGGWGGGAANDELALLGGGTPTSFSPGGGGGIRAGVVANDVDGRGTKDRPGGAGSAPGGSPGPANVIGIIVESPLLRSTPPDAARGDSASKPLLSRALATVAGPLGGPDEVEAPFPVPTLMFEWNAMSRAGRPCMPAEGGGSDGGRDGGSVSPGGGAAAGRVDRPGGAGSIACTLATAAAERRCPASNSDTPAARAVNVARGDSIAHRREFRAAIPGAPDILALKKNHTSAFFTCPNRPTSCRTVGGEKKKASSQRNSPREPVHGSADQCDS